MDDPRNTDNAWMETVAVNFHDDSGINKQEECSLFFLFNCHFKKKKRKKVLHFRHPVFHSCCNHSRNLTNYFLKLVIVLETFFSPGATNWVSVGQ